MSFVKIIEKKKNNIELSKEEITWLVSSFTNGSLKDYQMSAFNMAVWFNSMTKNEISYFTEAMVNSGVTYNLEGVNGPTADKHSTGGVGDKTSLIFAPLVAAFGVKVAKLSGRGLGQTGGTIDKLESCPGWTGEISESKFKQILNEVGLSIMSQSEDVVPADKKIYALRDVSGSVDSIPLIASSIMSKKLVIPADKIILDVKVGSGAFMKTVDDAIELSKTMINIGLSHKRDVTAMITNMNRPLGRAIGNALEVREAWNTLNGSGPSDLIELCVKAASITLVESEIFENLNLAEQEIMKLLKSGKAANLLKEFIIAQGGDFSVIENYDKNFKTAHTIEIRSPKKGYINFKSAESLGLLSMELGAGRKTKNDKIDFASGIYLNKTTDDYVEENEVVMTLFTNKDNTESFTLQAQAIIDILPQPSKEPLILKIMNKHDI